MEPLNIARIRRALNDNYVLVLTTNSIERKAVTDCFDVSAKAAIPAENDGARIGVCGGQLILHVTGTSGGQADKAVGRITRKILSAPNVPNPKAVILVGIAWGAPSNTSIGTVILCGELLAVNQLRFESDGLKFVPFGRTSPWLTELKGIADEIGSYPDRSLKQGILASGEQFVGQTKVRDALLKAYPEIAGGEMEGWDLVPDLDHIPWAQLRGVCDFGEDGTNGLYQVPAAMKAAEFLKPLLQCLQARERLKPIRRDPATVGLLEALAGEAMEVTFPDDGMSLDEHLNNRLGPSLVWRLAQYGIGTPASSALPRRVADLLLEMGQNALKHGGANHATIQFGGNSVTYSDDGQPFDLFSLTTNDRGRGGRTALAKVDQLVASGLIELKALLPRNTEHNRYRIAFPKLSARLRAARERCSVDFVYRSGPEGIRGERLEYDPKCDALFFDASELLMSSRRLDVIDELLNLLSQGKELFVQCADENEKAFYEDALSQVGREMVNVLVVPTVSSPGG